MEFIDKYFLKLNYSGWFFSPLTYRLWGRNSWDSKAANTILRPGDIYPWQLSWSCSVQYFVVLPWLPQSPRLVGWSAFWGRGEHRSQAAPTAVASCCEPSGCSAVICYNPTWCPRHSELESFQKGPATLWGQRTTSSFTGREISQWAGKIFGQMTGNQRHNGMKGCFRYTSSSVW